MPSLQKKGLAYYCQFLYQGRRRTVTVGRVNENTAFAFAERVEELLDLVARRLISVPPGADIAAFVANDGKVEEARAPSPKVVTSAFKEKYLETHGGGAMEENSLATVEMHLKQFEETLGPTVPERASAARRTRCDEGPTQVPTKAAGIASAGTSFRRHFPATVRGTL
jgi:hypothetical protein